MAYACWHVHGHLFDNIWKVAPNAVIYTGRITMRGPQDNWQDISVGSQMYPAYLSELCECRGEPQEQYYWTDKFKLCATHEQDLDSVTCDPGFIGCEYEKVRNTTTSGDFKDYFGDPPYLKKNRRSGNR